MVEFKKSKDEIKRSLANLLEEIEALRDMARGHGHSFSHLDEKELESKIKGETSNSPFIFGQSWSSGTSAGANASYTVHVSNPDPVGYFPFYATIFFGLGNIYDVNQGWIGRDKRWPEFSSDRTFLTAGASNSFTFNYTVPVSIPLGTYNGNVAVWRGSWHDIGTLYDRGSFDVKIS